MLKRLTATQFIRVMTSGRTAPLLCGCETGNGSVAGNFVVKTLSARNALHELVGSRLATHFGILVPEPAAVQLEQDFADAVTERLGRKIGVRLNFASKVVFPMSIWMAGRLIPEAMFQDATNVFAFDGLIQNPDRRVDNPNLFTQSDSIYIFDHEETSFSFLLALSQSEQPWNLEREDYLEKHAFFSKLRSRKIDLRGFCERLEALTPDVFERIKKDTPAEWKHADFERIESHLLAVSKNAGQFVEQVRRRLV
jgi:hypothetical protein